MSPKPALPALAGAYNTPGFAYNVYLSGSRSYVADYGSGLQIFDISDPDVLVLEWTIATNGSAYGVCLSDDYVYVANGYSGLQIISGCE